MSKVFWCAVPTSNPNVAPLHVSRLLFPAPVPLTKAVVESYPEGTFLKCPAFIDYCRNTYVVNAPLDVTITYDAEKKVLSTDTFSQHFFDAFCGVREDGTASFPPAYMFFSAESVMVEQFQVPLLPQADNAFVVPGVFDIGKWVRPVEYAFALRDPSKPLVIKKGTPLFAVRFTPTDGSKVDLEEVLYNQEMRNITETLLAYKTFSPNTPLKKLYEVADRAVKLFMRGYKKTGKCPFSFGGKK